MGILTPLKSVVELSGSNTGQAASVTPNDDADLALTPTEYVSVNTSGNVTLDTDDGDNVTVYLTRGYMHRIRAKRIYATGTDATGIIAWYDPAVTYAAGEESFTSDGLIADWDMAQPAGTQVWLDGTGDKTITAGVDSSVETVDPTFDGVKATLDGTDDFLNIYSGALEDAFNGDAGTVVMFAQVSAAGVWTDGNTRYLFHINAGGGNEVRIFKGGGTNQVLYRYVAGSTTVTVNDSTSVGTGKAMFAITWDGTADEFKAYLNGSQVGTTQTGLGTWAASGLNDTLTQLGATTTSGGTPWSGDMYRALMYDKALTASEIATMYATAQTNGIAD